MPTTRRDPHAGGPALRRRRRSRRALRLVPGQLHLQPARSRRAARPQRDARSRAPRPARERLLVDGPVRLVGQLARGVDRLPARARSVAGGAGALPAGSRRQMVIDDVGDDARAAGVDCGDAADRAWTVAEPRPAPRAAARRPAVEPGARRAAARADRHPARQRRRRSSSSRSRPGTRSPGSSSSSPTFGCMTPTRIHPARPTSPSRSVARASAPTFSTSSDSESAARSSWSGRCSSSTSSVAASPPPTTTSTGCSGRWAATSTACGSPAAIVRPDRPPGGTPRRADRGASATRTTGPGRTSTRTGSRSRPTSTTASCISACPSCCSTASTSSAPAARIAPVASAWPVSTSPRASRTATTALRSGSRPTPPRSGSTTWWSRTQPSERWRSRTCSCARCTSVPGRPGQRTSARLSRTRASTPIPLLGPLWDALTNVIAIRGSVPFAPSLVDLMLMPVTAGMSFWESEAVGLVANAARALAAPRRLPVGARHRRNAAPAPHRRRPRHRRDADAALGQPALRRADDRGALPRRRHPGGLGHDPRPRHRRGAQPAGVPAAADRLARAGAGESRRPGPRADRSAPAPGAGRAATARPSTPAACRRSRPSSRASSAATAGSRVRCRRPRAGGWRSCRICCAVTPAPSSTSARSRWERSAVRFRRREHGSPASTSTGTSRSTRVALTTPTRN